MNQYIRTNDEGQPELNYDLLDIAARANLREDAIRWATEIEVDLESEPDASNAERVGAIDNTADLTVKNTLAYLYSDEGDEVIIDPDTQQMIIDIIARELAEKYEVEL